MKKFNLKEAVKNLNEKLKNDKKFKARFATLTVAGVIVIATAITVPTVVHNNKIKAEENTTNVAVQAEPETETTTLPDGVETTVDAEGHVVPVTDESGNFVYTTATPETTIAAIESTVANVNNNTNNTAGGNKGSSSNTGSSNNKSTGGKKNTGGNKTNSGNKNNSGNKGNSGGSNSSGGSQQQGSRPVTEADVKAIVEEAKAYARNKYGFVIDSSLTEVGTSWGPETGILAKFDDAHKAKYSKDLHDEIDGVYKGGRQDFSELSDEEYAELWKKHPARMNIFYKHRPNDSAEPYYIYVVY
jgi:hypothetical protein|nr:MAG TPA: hypothetical protein [Caudoviricetes sp.]